MITTDNVVQSQTMDYLLVCLSLEEPCTLNDLEIITPPGKALCATLDECCVTTL